MPIEVTNDLVALGTAGIALWMLGVNTAIVYRFWPEAWFTVKMGAVSVLLAYVALSVLIGTVSEWEILLGASAVCVDAGALIGIWHVLSKAQAGDGVLIAYRRR